MPKFNITQIVQQTKSYEYIVEADTDSEALAKLDTLNFNSVSDGEGQILSTFVKRC